MVCALAKELKLNLLAILSACFSEVKTEKESLSLDEGNRKKYKQDY